MCVCSIFHSFFALQFNQQLGYQVKTNAHIRIPFLGPKSREILSMITSFDLSNENMHPNSAAVVKIKGQKGVDEFTVRLLRVSFVGELGYEIHIPKETCAQVYNILMKAGESYNLQNAGYRSLYSLSSEKGYDRKSQK